MSECPDFGDTLRSAREGQGLSIEDVSHQTRIPLATLRHLESDSYGSFPSMAYAKSFLAQYSEHLGVDASEVLDRFDTSDALANLDRYEYLKDHDERVDATPFTLKRAPAKAKAEKPVKPEFSHRTRTALQPVLVFSVTTLLIAGAVFGFMRLSANFSQESASAPEQDPEETLTPLSSMPGSRPQENRPQAPPEPANVPQAAPAPREENLVAGNSSRPGVETLRNAAPQATAPGSFSFDNPPPRAVIVEE